MSARGKFITGVVALVVSALVFVGLRSGPTDPVHRGRTLSDYLPIIRNFVNDPDRRISEAAKEALRQVDPEQSQPAGTKSP